MMTKNYDARVTFRTSSRVNAALETYARETFRSKNSLINEAVFNFVAENILHCDVKELLTPPGDLAG